MPLVILACCLLVVSTTVLHYEVLRALNAGLPRLGIPDRMKLVVVILATFVAHAVEIAMYGFVLYGLADWHGAGTLDGGLGFSLASCLYFSAETYTSLGFGDFTPVGAVRLLAGVEALNGLLLIGWSASFTYIAMERFWKTGTGPSDDARA
ncbi:potassium channel family protein [Ideonella sp. A 288]|uniref:potassium channel family protein n=1 Tax=Ideonella sp. A 288 TaxID=1962181 RepID=UPI000B4B4FB4|nr:potassium channel family protein [Ideonella sp. A 288]